MSAPVVGGAGGPQQPPGGGSNVHKKPPNIEPDLFDQAPCDEVILATGGYDHTIKFWQAHTGKDNCLLSNDHVFL
jgi:hypothetical protein